MGRHVFIVNFKVYSESSGDGAIRLAKICEKVAIETGADVRIAVNSLDIYPVSRAVGIPVYSEHVDPYPPGKHTGSVLPELVKTAGASGTLLNHSEHKMLLTKLKESLARARKSNLTTVVCADTLDEMRKILKLKPGPDFLAIEPPELIGGDVSVSSAHPEIISACVEQALRCGVRLLVGAGIKTRVDVARAFELGADGILVSSGVVLAKDPGSALRELII